MKFQSWVETHPYLAGVAKFEQSVDDALGAMTVADSEEAVTELMDRLDIPAGNEAMVRLLACHVMRRVVRSRIVENGNRSECPTCGATAALAVLVEETGGRRRILVCPCCHTKWNFKRVGCPYCGDESPQSILEVEGDKDHRIDACNQCRGYIKTFTGSGDMSLFLADWPTLHLDMLARERGYERLGTSLYDL